MAKVKGRVIDRNRFSKKYSLRRAPQRLTYQGDTDFSIELGSLTFSNESQKTFTFEAFCINMFKPYIKKRCY